MMSSLMSWQSGGELDTACTHDVSSEAKGSFAVDGVPVDDNSAVDCDVGASVFV